MTAAVRNQLAVLQYSGSRRDADASHAQLVCQQLVGELELIRLSSVTRCHQPPREARLKQMEARAGGRSRKVGNLHVKVAVQPGLQRLAGGELAPKRDGLDPDRSTRSLNYRVQRADVDTKQDRGSQHPFIADEAHFQAHTAADGYRQRHEAVRGEVGMLHGLPRYGQHLRCAQIDDFCAGEKAQAVFAGQRLQQSIRSQRACVD